ncbi:MAG: hypothetical protein VX589_19060 [Myxococcota bacterium]|nr:hypothetical protein [Myxococcota bacterium]
MRAFAPGFTLTIYGRCMSARAYDAGAMVMSNEVLAGRRMDCLTDRMSLPLLGKGRVLQYEAWGVVACDAQTSGDVSER